MRWAVVCVVAGCSFHAHDVPRDGMTDVAVDTAADRDAGMNWDQFVANAH